MIHQGNMIAQAIEMLKSSLIESQIQSIKQLALINNESIAEFLASFKDNPDPELRRQAVIALGTLTLHNETLQAEYTIDFFYDTEEDVRLNAAYSLLINEKSLDILSNLILDTSQPVRVRKVAIWALHRYRSTKVSIFKVLELLYVGLADVAPEIRQAAVESLGYVGDESTVPQVITALSDFDNNVRWVAAHTLARFEDKRAVMPLIEALKDRNSEVRYYAAGALGICGDVQAINPLIHLLEDPDITVRENAIDALGYIGDQQTLQLFQAMLDSVDSRLEGTLIRSISRLTKKLGN